VDKVTGEVDTVTYDLPKGTLPADDSIGAAYKSVGFSSAVKDQPTGRIDPSDKEYLRKERNSLIQKKQNLALGGSVDAMAFQGKTNEEMRILADTPEVYEAIAGLDRQIAELDRYKLWPAEWDLDMIARIMKRDGKTEDEVREALSKNAELQKTGQ
jgi:hypothetical protein